MDRVDAKILAALDKNVRATFQEIGKAARISKEVAQYRLKRLQDNNIITGFYGIINVPKLGYSILKVLVKYQSVSKAVQLKIREDLRNAPIISWAAECEGAYDLTFTIAAKNFKEIADFMNTFFTNYGFYFKEKEIVIPERHFAFNEKYISKGNLIYVDMLYMHQEQKYLDDKDLIILRELSLNSRKSFTDIGKKVKLTYWAVSERYKKLKKNEYITLLKPRINFSKLGLSYYHVFIEAGRENIKKSMSEYYTQHPACLALMTHTGFYSLHLEFVCSESDIDDIMLDLREKFGELIKSYELLKIKEEYHLNILR